MMPIQEVLRLIQFVWILIDQHAQMMGFTSKLNLKYKRFEYVDI